MVKEKEIEKDEQEIVINSIEAIRPKEFPLVVKLPEGASEAQIAYAKVINAYAYANPDKFDSKKDAFLKKLKELKDAPAPKTQGNLKINNSLV